MNKKIAIICASGIGDALILSIATHHLKQQGFSTTTFSPHLATFSAWLEHGDYLPWSKNWEYDLSSFHAVLLQHDNTVQAKEILSLRAKGFFVYCLYTNYRKSKHGALYHECDYVFDEKQCMVKNTIKAVEFLFGGVCSKKNVLKPPHGLIHQRYKKRIAIHPTSSSAEKTWLPSRFFSLFQRLKDNGFNPVFITSSSEQATWKGEGFSSLEELASFLYESGGFIGNDSGPSHLASYLQIPYVVVRQNLGKELWHPGWGSGTIICPPNFKILRSNWKYLISTRNVFNKLKTIMSTCNFNN